MLGQLWLIHSILDNVFFVVVAVVSGEGEGSVVVCRCFFHTGIGRGVGVRVFNSAVASTIHFLCLFNQHLNRLFLKPDNFAIYSLLLNQLQ